jgi:hypothetical protein
MRRRLKRVIALPAFPERGGDNLDGACGDLQSLGEYFAAQFQLREVHIPMRHRVPQRFRKITPDSDHSRTSLVYPNKDSRKTTGCRVVRPMTTGILSFYGSSERTIWIS